MATLQKLNGTKYPILICSQGVLPAKIFQSLAKEEGLSVQSHLSLGSLYEDYEINSQSISFGKTLKVSCLAKADGTLPTSSLLFPKVGMLFGGKFSTPRISVSLKIENVSLSSVLETKIPKKNFLRSEE